MSDPITAIYESGVLRLLTPLALPEKSHVQIYIQPIAPPEALAHRRQMREALVQAGLSLLPPSPAAVPASISADRRAELARIFSVGRPLSEIIIEEREDR